MHLTFIDNDIIINFIAHYNAAFFKDTLFKNIDVIVLFKAFKFLKGKRAPAVLAVINEINVLYIYTVKILFKNRLL